MATIKSLPDEVSSIILGDDNISIEDTLNFTSTCKRFQHILSNYNKFWEKKFYKRCFIARKRYYIKKQKNVDQISFEKKIRASLKCIKQLQYYVSLISDNNLTRNKKIKFERLLRSIAEDSMMYYFVLDELNKIISSELSRQHNDNLTYKYYFDLMSHYLKQYRFTYKLFKFLNMPKEKQFLEQLLTIVAQYFHPHISYSIIRTWLNDVTQKILSHLKDKYSKHSIFSTSSDRFSFWRDNNIYDNYWNPTDAEQIMDILEKFIFSELDVHQFLNLLDLEDEYINYISDFFQRCLRTIGFYSVARRLGIHCDIIPYKESSILIILWSPNYNAENFEYTKYLYMNEESDLPYPSNIIKGSCDYYYKEIFSPLSHIWLGISRYIFKDYKHNVYALQIALTHFIVFYFRRELKYYNIYRMWNDKFLWDCLIRCISKEMKDINIEAEFRNITRTIKIRSYKGKQSERRNEGILFAVGMIVKFSCKSSYTNFRDGVIIGWHSQCDTLLKQNLNKSLMFPYLRHSGEQYRICKCAKSSYYSNRPHYIILAENDIISYVQQDFILTWSPKLIHNIEIGRYFSRFEDTYYVPNKSLAKQYPEDTAVLLKYFPN